jgi:hypothetical protein
LKNGKAEVSSIGFPLTLTKKSAESFLQEIKTHGFVKGGTLGNGPIEITLFGKKIDLGLGSYILSEITIADVIEEVESRVKKLGETERVIIKIKSTATSKVIVSLSENST